MASTSKEDESDAEECSICNRTAEPLVCAEGIRAAVKSFLNMDVMTEDIPLCAVCVLFVRSCSKMCEQARMNLANHFPNCKWLNDTERVHIIGDVKIIKTEQLEFDYKCDKCDKVFLYAKGLNSHEGIHWKKENKKKPIKSKNKNKRKRTETMVYVCNTCNVEFDKESDLTTHKKKEHPSETHVNKKHKSDTKKKLPTVNERKENPALPCQECEQVFYDQVEYVTHQKIHRKIPKSTSSRISTGSNSSSSSSNNTTVTKEQNGKSKPVIDSALFEKHKNRINFRECTGRFYCNMCMTSRPDKYEAIAHVINDHPGVLNNENDTDESSSNTIEFYNEGKYIALENSKYQCKLCEFVCSSMLALDNHMLKEININDTMREKMGYIKVENDKFKCLNCVNKNKMLNTDSGMIQHIRHSH